MFVLRLYCTSFQSRPGEAGGALRVCFILLKAALGPGTSKQSLIGGGLGAPEVLEMSLVLICSWKLHIFIRAHELAPLSFKEVMEKRPLVPTSEDLLVSITQRTVKVSSRAPPGLCLHSHCPSHSSQTVE